MKTIIYQQLAAASLAAILLHSSAQAGAPTPFQGTLEGTYTSTPNSGTRTATIDNRGAGNATQLGWFTYVFPHTVNFGTLPPTGTGTYTFTAANGDTLVAAAIGHSSPVQPGVLLVVEEAVILGGTGRFTGATGEFTIVRLLDQAGGTTAGSFEGTIYSHENNQ